MKYIQLTQGQVAIVDDEDFERLSEWKWHAVRLSSGVYYAARCGLRELGVKRKIYMHREVMGLAHGDKRMCDHRDRDTLNNQRSNLRPATPAENQFNARTQINNKSGYKGVYWIEKRRKFRVVIQENGAANYLGHFDDPVKGALAYDRKASEIFGEFALLNFPVKQSA